MATAVGKRDAYIGETNKQIREGFGVYNYENKFFRYEGEWRGGKKHGHGKLVMADGSYYEGTFESGEIEGHGFRYFSSTGNTYSGQFHQGELHGQGIMKYKNGAIYEGMWAFNKRSGYGVFKNEDNSMYQGYLHNHMRHGEGTQIYSNGDRYDGDWVNDKRQGHGELRCQDGTLFDGQWLNDLLHGQGSMHHSSGMFYEGIWHNGRPADMAAKLVITTTSPMATTQGEYFEVTVECQQEDGTPTKDQGRELLVTAGYRNVLPTLVEGKGKKAAIEVPKLFDVIEDMEEKPITTPFDYDMVSYPLTDQMPDRETLGDPPEPSFVSSRQVTNLTESSEVPVETRENTELELGGEEKKEEDGEKKEVAETEESKSEEQGAAEEGAAPEQKQEPDPEPPRPEESLPPPVESKRTEFGQCAFTRLILPGAPPMYRPFTVLDEEARMEKVKQLAKAGKKVPKDRMTQEEQKSRAKKMGDERYARPGEYVIMVQDVTNPPFMGSTLEPAFIQVKQVLPKKAKKAPVKKERGPKRPHWCPKCSDVSNVSEMTIRERIDAVQSSLGLIKEEAPLTGRNATPMTARNQLELVNIRHPAFNEFVGGSSGIEHHSDNEGGFSDSDSSDSDEMEENYLDF